MMIGKADPRIPKELQAAPPRMVRLRSGRGGRLFGVRIFMLPHVLIGLIAAVILIGEPIWLFATPAISGRITFIQTSQGRHGTQHQVNYTYVTDGHIINDRSRVSDAAYQSLKGGSPIKLHVINIGGHQFSEVDVSGQQYADSRWFLWIWAIFWNGMMLLMLRQPIVARRLVRDGQPLRGKIVDKMTYRGKSNRFSVKYEYTPQAGGSVGPTTRSMTVMRQDFQSAEAGQEITVIYDPLRPSQAVIYEYGDYMAG